MNVLVEDTEVFLFKEEKKLLSKYREFKKEKDYEKSDKIRDDLGIKGIKVVDSSEGDILISFTRNRGIGPIVRDGIKIFCYPAALLGRYDLSYYEEVWEDINGKNRIALDKLFT